MSRASDGTYTRVSNSFSQPVTGTLIRSDHADTFWDELETEMTDSLSRTGKGGMLAHLSPNTDDGFALGTTTKKWSDLHLASGAVINWNAGDLLLAHSADALALTGGTFTFTAGTVTGGTFSGPILSAADARGTWTAGSTWTLPAHVLGGAVTASGSRTYGIDLSGGTYATATILMPNAKPLAQKDSGGTVRSLLGITSADAIVIGDGFANIFVSPSTALVPVTDNASQLGGPSNRWASVHTLASKLYGSSSGVITLQATAVAGTNTLTLPAETATLATQAIARFWCANSRGILNSFDAAHLTMDMSADHLVLYNPNNDTALRGGTGPFSASCNLATTGAGGRDTGSAPASGENWWFYFIKGAATSVSTLASKTAPFGINGSATIGPVLPATYTHYVPAFPVVISDADTLVFDSHQLDETTTGTFNGHISGTTLTLDSVVTGVALVIGNKITGAGVLANTLLTAGAGSSWTVNKSQSVGSGGSPVAMTSTTPYPSSPVVVDNFVEFSSEILIDLSDDAGFASYDWSYATWIPTAASFLQLQVSLQVSCNDSTLDEFTGGFVFNWIDATKPNAGNSINASLNSFGYRQPAYADPIVILPIQSTMLLTFTWVNGNGAANATPVTVAMPLGYYFEK